MYVDIKEAVRYVVKVKTKNIAYGYRGLTTRRDVVRLIHSRFLSILYTRSIFRHDAQRPVPS